MSPDWSSGGCHRGIESLNTLRALKPLIGAISVPSAPSAVPTIPEPLNPLTTCPLPPGTRHKRRDHPQRHQCPSAPSVILSPQTTDPAESAETAGGVLSPSSTRHKRRNHPQRLQRPISVPSASSAILSPHKKTRPPPNKAGERMLDTDCHPVPNNRQRGFKSGGEAGIRTLGGVISPTTA